MVPRTLENAGVHPATTRSVTGHVQHHGRDVRAAGTTAHVKTLELPPPPRPHPPCRDRLDRVLTGYATALAATAAAATAPPTHRHVLESTQKKAMETQERDVHRHSYQPDFSYWKDDAPRAAAWEASDRAATARITAVVGRRRREHQ